VHPGARILPGQRLPKGRAFSYKGLSQTFRQEKFTMTEQQFNATQKSLEDIQVLLLAGFSVLVGQNLADAVERKSGKALEYFDYVKMLDKDGMELILSRLSDAQEGLAEFFKQTATHSD
jgi:hypothetical protein